ncbi:hypothetical protein OSSY52_15560 [Tepiditoga spiralis]|uniref:HD-GYP domain-containing protein n=1 Tax=Tepiditoga spiralis TaxID=2108365 RepID=A0A7G1G5M0_9BACT|nr:HD domain-containing phosphohydrolase [Tepiditoga spiralis]BBE31415.1 hypothetical protein OSSY52_15560 [Tepiditoga spiralis]
MKKLLLYFCVIFIGLATFSLDLKVGTYSDFPNSFYTNENTGVFTEILKDIANEKGWNLTIYNDTKEKINNMFFNNRLDIIYPTLVDSNFIIKDSMKIFTNSESIISIFDLKNKWIGVKKNSIFYKQIKDILNKNNVRCIFSEYESYDEIFKELKNKKIDIAVVSKNAGLILANKYNFIESRLNFSEFKFGIIAKDKTIQENINDYIIKIKENPNSIYYKTLKKYFNKKNNFILIEKDIYIYSFFIFAIIVLFFSRKKHIKKNKKILKLKETLEKELYDIKKSLENLEIEKQKLSTTFSTDKKAKESLKSIIDINSNISEYMNIDEDLFLTDLFRTSLNLLGADYGSIQKFEKNKWKFVDSIGHDINILKNLDLDRSYSVRSNEIKKINNIMKENESNMPLNVLKDLKEATKKIKTTLYIPFFVNQEKVAAITYDIKENSKKDFFGYDITISRAFKEIGESILKIKRQNKEFRNAYIKFANKLAIVSEAHDDVTGNHIYRVGILSEFIAEKMGLNYEFVEEIKNFAPLHDVGKIFIPIGILNKKGRLTRDEFDIIKKHTTEARKILEDNKYFKTALNIALCHHEKFNGGGYPYGIRGSDIPIEAQIVALADIYDALRSERPYKKGFSHKKATEIILEGDGRIKPEHFNPKVLEVFRMYNSEFEEIYDSNAGEKSKRKFFIF